MKIIDMLAGKPSNDPKDLPSGVKFSVEPSAGLLEIVDVFAKEKGATREVALLAYAALGAVSKSAVSGFFGALLGGTSSEDDLKTREARMRRKELAVARALAKKEALDEAAKACDAIARSWEDSTGSPCVPAMLCEGAIMKIKQRVVEETGRTT